MKVLPTLLYFLFLAATPVIAQPGDPDLEHHVRYFNEIQDSIVKYPNEPFYKWVRADLLFSPYFDIDTKSSEELEKFLSYSSEYQLYVQDSIAIGQRVSPMSAKVFYYKKANPAHVLGDFIVKNQKRLIADLTELIERDATFKDRFMNTIGQYTATANKSSFLYKRGQLYYVSGHPEKAIQDYMAALDAIPFDELKSRIYLSIAAYYCNTEDTKQKENYALALKYLKIIEPAIEDSSFSKGEEPGYYGYEREKLALMRKYDDSTAYVNYLQNRAASYLNYYYSILAERAVNNKPSDQEQQAFDRAHEYELMIYEYLKELNTGISEDELKKQKKIIEGKL